MEENQPIVIATTIAPAGDLSTQRRAIAGWLEQGFRVLAVNHPGEIQNLRAFFPGVEFVPAPRDAAGKFGRPFVFLDDLFAALAATGAEICGIVNADIHLCRRNLPAFFRREAAGSFVFGARLDVPSLENPEKGVWFGGFDFFFFDRSLVPYYPPEDFCLGLPWWDYWIILVPLAMDLPVKRLVSPIAYHVVHPTRYGPAPWKSLGATLAKYFTPTGPLNEDTMAKYNVLIFDLIWRNPAVINVSLSDEP